MVLQALMEVNMNIKRIKKAINIGFLVVQYGFWQLWSLLVNPIKSPRFFPFTILEQAQVLGFRV